MQNLACPIAHAAKERLFCAGDDPRFAESTEGPDVKSSTPSNLFSARSELVSKLSQRTHGPRLS